MNANSGFVGVAPQKLNLVSRRKKSGSQLQNWTATTTWNPESKKKQKRYTDVHDIWEIILVKRAVEGRERSKFIIS